MWPVPKTRKCIIFYNPAILISISRLFWKKTYHVLHNVELPYSNSLPCPDSEPDYLIIFCVYQTSFIGILLRLMHQSHGHFIISSLAVVNFYNVSYHFKPEDIFVQPSHSSIKGSSESLY